MMAVEKHTDKAPAEAPRAFVPFLHEIRQGVLTAELAEAIQFATQAALDAGKKSTITLKLVIEPDKSGIVVSVTDSLDVRTPQAPKAPTIFFPDEHGNLTRRNPAQPNIPGTEAAPDDPNATGPVIQGVAR